MKKLLNLALCILAVITVGAGSLSTLNVKAESNYTLTFEECETSPSFDAVRLHGCFEPLRIVNPNGAWYLSGYPAGAVHFSMGVSVNDWSNATALRVRISSHKLPGAYSNSTNNNMAVGFGGLNSAGDYLYRKVTKPYGNAKFTNPDGSTKSPLYYVNDSVPYFNMGRQQNCYVEMPLDDNTFTWATISPTHVFQKNGSESDPMDMTNVRFVYVELEPLNYESMCIDIGAIEIKIDDEWVSVFNPTESEIVSVTTTQYKTIASLKANQCVMTTRCDDSVGANTDAYRIYKMKAEACEECLDNDFDALCDRCYLPMPHSVFDLDGDGVCDDCGTALCETCVDANKDGACDVCFHTDNVEKPAPDSSSSNENSSSQGGTTQNSSSGKEAAKGGCFGSLGVSTLLFAVAPVVAMFLLRKKED